MKLRGFPPNDVPALSYVGSPGGVLISVDITGGLGASWDTISGKPAVVAAGATQAAARSAIGAVAQTDIDTAVTNLKGTAGAALDTLGELSDALEDDANYAATITTALAGKQPIDSDLTAIAALSTTSFGRSLLTQADAAAARTTVGVKQVSITQYGATTGAADNATAIQNAINAVATAGGGEVFVPTGTWITSPIVLKSYVTLRGEGAYSSILKLKNGANTHFVTLQSGQTIWIGLQDVGFDGNKANQTTGDVVRLDNTGFDDTGPTMLANSPNHYVRRVVVTNGKSNGVSIISDTEGQCQLVNVFAYDNDADGIYLSSPDNQLDHCIVAKSGLVGFHLVGANQSRLLGCKAFFNGHVTPGSGNGFQFDSGSSRVDALHCEAQDNLANGFVLIGAADCTIIGKSERNGWGASPYAGGAGDGIYAAGVTNSYINLNCSDRNSGGVLKQGRGFNCGVSNQGNIVELTIGAMKNGVAGIGSWGSNSLVTYIYNGGTPVVQSPVSDATQTALNAKAPLDATLNAQTGTTYTFVAGDDGKVVTATNAAAQTYTVPQNSAAAIPIGAYIEVIQLGAGQVTFVAGTGATVNSRGGALKINGQYGVAALRKVSTNGFVLMGDLTT